MSIYSNKTPRRIRTRCTTSAIQYQDTSLVIKRRKRFWEVIGPGGELVCLTVYKRGAFEVARHLALKVDADPSSLQAAALAS